MSEFRTDIETHVRKVLGDTQPTQPVNFLDQVKKALGDEPERVRTTADLIDNEGLNLKPGIKRPISPITNNLDAPVRPVPSVAEIMRQSAANTRAFHERNK